MTLKNKTILLLNLMKSLFWFTVHNALEPHIPIFTGAFVDVSILHTSDLIYPYYRPFLYKEKLFLFEHVIVIRSVDATPKMCFFYL